ncbi:MAG TPA: hypothetical protein VFB54_15925 [Burkholderiales bacterium]|nr:hypothetical protein [Burkholderiales bacterium]
MIRRKSALRSGLLHEIRVYGCPELSTASKLPLRAILGQQITVRAAHTLAGRFAAAFGEQLETTHAMLCCVFPSPRVIAALDPIRLAEQGVVMQRAKAIVGLAQALVDGKLRLEPHADLEVNLAQLQSISGVGAWTAHYIAMRALRWRDAFPHADYGVRKALGGRSAAEVLRHAEQWRPWRAYAVMHLWRSLEEAC